MVQLTLDNCIIDLWLLGNQVQIDCILFFFMYVVCEANGCHPGKQASKQAESSTGMQMCRGQRKSVGSECVYPELLILLMLLKPAAETAKPAQTPLFAITGQSLQKKKKSLTRGQNQHTLLKLTKMFHKGKSMRLFSAFLTERPGTRELII